MEFGQTLKAQARTLDDTSLFVKQRYNRMVVAKTDYTQRMQAVWELIDEPSNWIMYAYRYSTPIRTNTLRDTINSLTDMFMKGPPEADLEASKRQFKYGAIGLKAYIDGIKDSIHEKKIKRKVLQDMFTYGNGFRGVMYHSYAKQIGAEKITVFDDIATYRIDPRNIFIDENAYQLHDATCLEQARDVIHKRFFDYDTFIQYFSQWDGIKNLKEIIPVGFFNDVLGTNYQISSHKETTEKSMAVGVHVYEYMNQVDGRYIIVANDITIYEDTLIKSKGTSRIPIIQYQFEPRPDSPYAKSVGELLAPYIYAEDTLINLELMNIKLTLQPVLAISGDFGFNPRVHVIQPGGVWTAGGSFSGKIGDSIQPVISGNAATNFYNMQNLLQNKMTLTSRTDLRNLEDAPNTTATQVLAQQKNFNVHNETIENINEVEAEGVLTEIMLDQIRAYMNVKDEEGRTKRVKIKGYKVQQSESGEPTFISRSGEEDFFDMTQSIVDTEVKAVVRDKRSEVANNVEKIGRWMQFLPVLSQLMQVRPELSQKVNVEYVVEEMMEALGINTRKAMKQDADDYTDQFTLLKEEIIFGHNIDCPKDEEREDSIRRIKFLLSLKSSKDWAKFAEDDKANRAWEYHFDSTMENIQASHMPVGEDEQANVQAQGPDRTQILQQMQPQGLVQQQNEAMQAPQENLSNLLPQ